MPFKSGKPNYDNSNSRWAYKRSSIQVGAEAVRITVLDDNGNPTEDSIKVNIEDMPIKPRMPAKGTFIPNCVVFAEWNKPKVVAVNPWEGRFEAIAYDLGPKSDDGDFPVYTVEEMQGDNGTYVRKKFWCAYEIQKDLEFDGLWVGSTPRYHLQHRVQKSEDGMVELDGNAANPNSTRIRQFANWTAAQQIDQDMQWPEDGNALPEFLRRLKANSKPVTITIDKGFIQTVSRIYGAPVAVAADLDEPAEKKEESRYDHPGLDDPDFGK